MILANRAAMSTASIGTGTLTLATALGAVAPNTCSYQAFNSAGITDGNEIPYLILDSNGNWEQGYGTYTASGTTLSRNVVYSNNSNNAINLSGNAQVFIGAIAAAAGDLLGGFPNPMRGFDAPVNLQLNASVGSNLLTVSFKGNNGNDPSPTNPVYIPFRDPTAANGDPIWRRITSSLSINTNATGATLGSSNNTAFRFWVVLFDNAGTVVPALINCLSSALQIFPLNETNVASTTAISGSATAAGTFYTPNGTTLTNKAFRIVGYVEYNSTGLATAGTYASAPNFIQLFGPGVKKPGDVIQTVPASSTTAATTTSATFTTLTSGFTVSITPTSAANPIRVEGAGGCQQSAAAVTRMRLSRGTVANTNMFGSTLNFGGSGGINVALNLLGYDQPNTTSAQTYAMQGSTSTGTLTSPQSGDTNFMFASEIMG